MSTVNIEIVLMRIMTLIGWDGMGWDDMGIKKEMKGEEMRSIVSCN